MIEILTYIATFSPGIAAIAAIIIFIFLASKEIKSIVGKFGTDADSLKQRDEELIARLDNLIQDNAELKAKDKVLCDTLTHIDDYIENKMKEKQNGKK